VVVPEVDPGDQPLQDRLVEDAVLYEVEPLVPQPMLDLGARPVVEDEDLVAAIEKRIAEMRAEEPRATGHEHPHECSPSMSPLCTWAALVHSRASVSTWPATWTRSSRSAPSPVPTRTASADTSSRPGP